MHRRFNGLDHAHQDMTAVHLQGRQIRVQVMVDRNGIQQEVKALGSGGHLLRIGRDDDVVGALLLRFGHLGFGAGKDGDLGPSARANLTPI